MFGQDSKSPTVCPGENKCGRWLSAAGANRDEKSLNACTGCELLPTKRDGGKSDKAIKELIARARGTRAQRLTGIPLKEWMIGFKEYRALVLIEELIDQHRMIREEQNHNFLMHAAGFKKE